MADIAVPGNTLRLNVISTAIFIFSVALAVTTFPAAVTTSKDSTLSQVSPCLRTSHPTPPPSVRPAIPVFDTIPAGTARP